MSGNEIVKATSPIPENVSSDDNLQQGHAPPGAIEETINSCPTKPSSLQRLQSTPVGILATCANTRNSTGLQKPGKHVYIPDNKNDLIVPPQCLSPGHVSKQLSPSNSIKEDKSRLNAVDEKNHTETDEEDEDEEDEDQSAISPKTGIHGSKSSVYSGDAESMSQGNLNASSSFYDTALGRFVRQVLRWKEWFLDSEYFARYRRIMDNAKYQILTVGLLQMLIFASILCVIQFVLNSDLSAIKYYNLMHAVLAWQGKFLLGFGHHMSVLVRKGFAAVEMQNHKKGISITEIENVDPSSCRQLNRLYELSLVAIEISLWVISFYMDWEPVETYLKSGPCTLPTFYTPWNMTTELETWVGSNTDFGTLAAYGLPTTNGLIGGTAATPKQPPTYAFQMNGPGIAFLISTVCMSPKPIPYPNTTHTSSLIISDQFWGEMYSVGLQLRFPAGTHAWKQYSHQDITQTCQLDLVFGAADITFAYISDVWGSISPSGLKEIKINEDLVITPDNSVQFDFGTLHLAFGETEQLYENLTASVREGIRILLNDSDMVSVVTRGDTASSLIWGLNEDGLYDPAKTWNALSGAVAVISHYVLDQNDNTESSVCEFRGLAGWGKIASPLWATWTVNSLVLVGFVMEIIVLASWLVVVGGGEHIDRCIAMIDKPLRTIYYMRESAGRLVTKIRGKDIGDISLHQHLEKVKVRFGEDKRTRGEEVGTLILAEPSRVVKASRYRKLV